MGFDFLILGPLAVVEDGVSLRLGGPRTRTLLAAFLVEADRFVSRDRLIDELWGDEPPASAENALQAQVASLRRLLPGRIVTSGTTYRLAARPEEVDARRFEAAVRKAQGLLEADPATAAVQLASALSLWRGPALDGEVTGRIVGAEATRLDALRRAAQVDRADACLAAGRPEIVVAELAGLVAGDPTDERLAGRLMLAQYRSNGSGDALATFDRVSEALAQELAAAPEAALVELRRAIERHDPTLAGPTAGLPAPTTRFIGREREIQAAYGLLVRSRLLTLIGPGGCGKSRLALELARTVATEGPAEVHLVALAALPSGGSVTRLVGDVLDVRERRGESLVASLVSNLQNRRTLLLLDNCEHLLPMVAGLCSQLLAGVPGLRILATSREPLGAPGEVTWAVSGLGLPLPTASEAEMLESDSMQLLADRAVAARPGFALSGDVAASGVALCRRLDGLPLAIELAAARLRSMSLAEIVARLEGRMDLPARAQPSLDRHRTMRAAIDWSHDLLAPDEQQMLRRLAVFRGRLDAEAALAVWGAAEPNDDPFASLSRLADRSMVVAEPSLDGPTMYRLLETVRQYAEERLAESGESRATRARHASWCAGLVAAARDWGGSQQETWLIRLAGAHNDLLAALIWSLGDGSNPDGALSMTADLWWFWYMGGHVTEGLAWLRRALAAASPVPSKTRAAALRGASALARSSGDYPEAILLGEQCLAMCRGLDDRGGVAASLNSLCATALAMGCLEDAVRYGEEGLAVVRGTGNGRGLGASLTNLGTALRNLDRFDDAELALREAAGVFQGLGDVRGEISTIINRAILERRRGRIEDSRRCCVEALRHCVALGHAEGEVDCLDVVAAIDVAEGRMAAGMRLFKVVGATRRRLGLEVSTPDERRDRDSALTLARASLNADAIADVEAAAGQIDITSAAIEVLDAHARDVAPGHVVSAPARGPRS